MEKYCRALQATKGNLAHAHCKLQGYRHILIICNSYCFSNATMVAGRCSSVLRYNTLPIHFLLQNVPTHSWPSLSHLLNGCQALFPEIKRPGREGDYSPTRSARAKNAYSSVSALSCAFTVQSVLISLNYISHVKMCSGWKWICMPTLTRHWTGVIS